MHTPEPDWGYHNGEPDCLCKGCNQRREAERKRDDDVKRTAGEEIAMKIADYINGCKTSKYFADGMKNQHRTLHNLLHGYAWIGLSTCVIEW